MSSTKTPRDARVEPSPEHRDKPWHWIATTWAPDGMPMRWSEEYGWTFLDAIEDTTLTPGQAATWGFAWLGPCLPPERK